MSQVGYKDLVLILEGLIGVFVLTSVGASTTVAQQCFFVFSRDANTFGSFTERVLTYLSVVDRTIQSYFGLKQNQRRV